MESICLASTSLPFNPLPGSRKINSGNRQQRRVCTGVFASSRRGGAHDGGGRLVDENLIVLRKRIHERKMMERNYEPPSNWMEWEKQCYTNYDSIICEAMGVLQAQLMNTRPSLALGMVALIGLSVPTSMAVILFHLINLGGGVLAAGIHLYY